MAFSSKLKRTLQSLVFAGALAAPSISPAAELEFFPKGKVGAEMSYKVAGYDRVMGSGYLLGEADIFSYAGVRALVGAKFVNYFRTEDKTTQVQPDIINYDVWLGIGYSAGFGELSLSHYHQCMHDIDEKDQRLIDDTRSHNILRLAYDGELDFLEGLKLSVATGPYTQAVNSRYMYMFDVDAQLSLFKLWDTGKVYLRVRANPIIAEKKDGFLGFNNEDEIGIELEGKWLHGQAFIKYQRIEDYFIFDSGFKDFWLVGLRIQ